LTWVKIALSILTTFVPSGAPLSSRSAGRAACIWPAAAEATVTAGRARIAAGDSAAAAPEEKLAGAKPMTSI